MNRVLKEPRFTMILIYEGFSCWIICILMKWDRCYQPPKRLKRGIFGFIRFYYCYYWHFSKIMTDLFIRTQRIMNDLRLQNQKKKKNPQWYKKFHNGNQCLLCQICNRCCACSLTGATLEKMSVAPGLDYDPFHWKKKNNLLHVF